jgi:WD40 repeat protein
MKTLGITISVLLLSMTSAAVDAFELTAQGEARPVASVEFSPDGTRLLVAYSDDGRSAIWRLTEDAVDYFARDHAMTVADAAFGNNGDSWAEAGALGQSVGMNIGLANARGTIGPGTVWRDHGLSSNGGPGEMYMSVAYGSGNTLIAARENGTVDYFNLASGGLVRSERRHTARINEVAISISGESYATASCDGYVKIQDPEGASSWNLNAGIQSVDISADGSLVAAGADTGQVWVSRKPHGSGRLAFTVDYPVTAVALVPGSNTVLAGHENGGWSIIDYRQRAVRFLGRPAIDPARVTSIDVRKDGDLAAIGHADGTVRLWDLQRQQLKLRLFDFGGTWAVVDAEQRFYSNRPENLPNLGWRHDYIESVQPVDILMQERFTDKLLSRTMRDEDLPAAVDLDGLDPARFVQPGVEILGFRANPQDRQMVQVHIRVTSNSRRDRSGRLVHSGAKDLKLLRDGKLVAALNQSLLSEGSGEYSFTVRMTAYSQQFTAYAFSSRGVRSKSASGSHRLEQGTVVDSGDGRAYLMNIGINAHRSPAFDLRYAVNDARIMNETLSRALRHINITVQPQMLLAAGDKHVSKAEIETRLRGLANSVRGNDLVILTFSGHGYRSESGEFYLLPSDVSGHPDGNVDDFLSNAISSAELGDWLQNVNPANFVFIIDACHSAGSVAVEGFKPAPLDGRGLGQLAYDKKMIVLAASQASDVALEHPGLQQGLLSYALVNEGLQQNRADHDPVDGRVTLREWMRYGLSRVPTLYNEVSTGQYGAQLVDVTSRRPVRSRPQEVVLQQPSLFDFSRIGDNCPLTIQSEDPGKGSWRCGSRPMAPTLIDDSAQGREPARFQGLCRL